MTVSVPGAPRVAVLVPARNEQDAIGACLACVLDQDLDPAELEVVVVDGGSSDDTRRRAEVALAGSGLARTTVVDNPAGTTPSNLNRGLAEVRAPVVCRVDARSRIGRDYVRRCAETLERDRAVAVVGGAQVAVAPSSGAVAVGIARALNNRWGMGGARYRRGAASGPADTVYLGAFRTAQLRQVGGWDERLGTNQDFDLNRRMGRLGTVWFDAALAVGYLPRPSLSALARQYRRFGEGKVRYWELTGDRPQRRQVVLLGAPVVAVGTGALLWAGADRRGRRRLAAAGMVGAAAFELAGSDTPRGTPVAHAVSLVATGVISVSWLAGVWGGVARRLAGGAHSEVASGVSR